MDQIVEEAAEIAAQRQAIHREAPDALAVGGQAPATHRALRAARMPRHDNRHTRLNAAATAGLDDLRHALVADRERSLERRPARDDRAIEIARSRRDRAHDRTLLRIHRGLGDFAKLNPTPSKKSQLLHPKPTISSFARRRTPPRLERRREGGAAAPQAA